MEDNNGNFKLPKLVKETWRPKKRKMDKDPGFYQQDKAKEELASDDKKDENNGLQQSDNKNIRFEHEPNNFLDHLMNSLEKDTEIKENKTKIKSEKFAPDADKDIGNTRSKIRKCERIPRKKLLIQINDEPRNKMVESDRSTVLFSLAQWQTDAEDMQKI